MNSFDRIGIALFWGSDSAFIDHLALTLTSPLVWVPFFVCLLVLVLRSQESNRERMVCLASICVCLALSAGVCNVIVKPLVCRVRPCNEPELAAIYNIVEEYAEQNYSFFSSHAANYMGLTMLLALLVRHWMLTGTMLLLTLVNVWTRLYLGQHYLSDICVGLVWGCVSGYLGWLVWRKYSREKQFVSPRLTDTGYALTDIYASAAVFFATVAVVVVMALL